MKRKEDTSNEVNEEQKAPAENNAVDQKQKTKDDEIALLKRQVEAMSSQIKTIAQNSSGNLLEAMSIMSNKSIAPGGVENVLYDESTIDEDDYISNPWDQVVFFAPFSFYVISDDIRKGRPVRTPYRNAILFEYAGENKVDTGKGKTLNVYSIYTCKSRKEAEWLENHRHFNIYFFKDWQKAIKVDHMVMEAMGRHYSSVSQMDPSDVRYYMMQYPDLKERISSDPEQNKRELAFFLGMRDREKIINERSEKGMPIYQGDNKLSEEDLAGLESRTATRGSGQ